MTEPRVPAWAEAVLTAAVGRRLAASVDYPILVAAQIPTWVRLLHEHETYPPHAFDPEWRTEAVVGIARAIVETGAADRFGILADALTDAGCCEPLDALREYAGVPEYCWWVWNALGRRDPWYRVVGLGVVTLTAIGPPEDDDPAWSAELTAAVRAARDARLAEVIDGLAAAVRAARDAGPG